MLLLALIGCTDECRKYSNFSCSEIQEATYNVYFYFPNKSEYYLGIANGLKQCGYISHNYAYSKKLSRSSAEKTGSDHSFH